ncbi:unnamed protein product [Pleuronectes platessa]|uniref:Uncharacterized protein n=1 Tax=Pleuronectes platessa TaxID=8262 RepID=A0A9N7Z9Q4_PLEPL|nr:unnamed protein product [Pleuronectes platessa]
MAFLVGSRKPGHNKDRRWCLAGLSTAGLPDVIVISLAAAATMSAVSHQHIKPLGRRYPASRRGKHTPARYKNTGLQKAELGRRTWWREMSGDDWIGFDIWSQL